MSSLKRAKWVEGITKSKRILRDIAEIVTTAIQDEAGVLAEENWSLVYPRPFSETLISRATLIQDGGNPKKYIPVALHSAEILLADTNPTVLPITKNILASTVKVQSVDEATTYAVTDFLFDDVAGTVARTAASTIPNNATVKVSFGVKFFKVLTDANILLEEKLTLENPDRLITPVNYEIDTAAAKVRLLIDPPADAMYFALSFTEKTSTYGRTARDMVSLEVDPLDGSGRTLKLPAGTGEIMTQNDSRQIGGASGGLNAVGDAPYVLDPVNMTIKFTTAPVLPSEAKLLLTAYFYDDATLTSSTRQVRVELAEDATDISGKTYKPVGAFIKINEGRPHSVELFTKNTAPELYKHLDPLNAGYAALTATDYTLDNADNNPSVTVKETYANNLFLSFTARGPQDLQAGLNKITDRVVLKTRTTPENQGEVAIGSAYGAKDTSTALDMYVEIVKPVRLINPETGLERFTSVVGAQVETQPNNHFIMTRMFDKWDETKQQAQVPTYDSLGNMSQTAAYVSEWAKYAWFQDWKEYLVDSLDTDPGAASIGDGVIMSEVVVKGMSEEFPIQFWISTNNNRIAIVLMGDPTLDQDNFLTSFAYLGRIHPFYDSEWQVKKDEQGAIIIGTNGNPVLEEVRHYFENDVAGNFAITTGSSTIPAAIGQPPKGQPIVEAVELNQDSSNELIPGDLWDGTAYSYLVTYLTAGGESRPSKIDSARLIVNKGKVVVSATTPTRGLSVKLRFTLPEEATGYKIYRYFESNKAAFTPADVIKYEYYKEFATVTRLGRERTVEHVDDGVSLPMGSATVLGSTKDNFYNKFTPASSSARSFNSVVRDRFTGAILNVKFSDAWGVETGTGVNDIVMFQTRSGLKFQRHQPAFITTEQFMRKERSGQSRYTGKFHLSPIYVEHSYDKQRGWLNGVMAVDDAGIEHLDELIVDKDQPTEEVYKFFRLSAPYSFLNNSPNYAYGVAIIKSSQRWEQ